MSRPTGRNTRIGAGSGNFGRRGSGLGGGPVGGGGRPPSGGGSGSSGRRGYYSQGGSGGYQRFNVPTSGSGCLTRIIPIVVVVIIILIARNSSGGLGGLFGGDDTAGGIYDTGTGAATGAAALDDYGTGLFTGGTGGNTTAQEAYKAHAVDTSVDSAARAKYTQLKGDGTDTATILLYLCGTDLESESGMATADLNEIAYAKSLDNINIIVETGGTKNWQNSVISDRTNQRYQVTSKGLVLLEDNLGRKPMTDPGTLSDFIRYGAERYPADRMILILWDHGGGSISGYGYDEYEPGDTMTIDEIGTALKNGGVQFDLVGFDACLMGTLETAFVLEPYADYMIASEATEPGTGWYYTDWVTMLAQDPGAPTTKIGKQIIDDFIDKSARQQGGKSTLSLIDLAEMRGTVPSAFRAFAEDTKGLLDAEAYQQVADARSGARDFSASSKINQIDLVHFVKLLDTGGGEPLTDALDGCVKYNRISSNMTNANGVSIYFPYQSLSKVNQALSTYEKIGMDDEYTDCVKSFASLAAGGQIVASGGGAAGSGTDLFSMLTGGGSTASSSGSGLFDSLFGGGGSALSTGDVESLLGSFLSSGSSQTFGTGGLGGTGSFSASDLEGWFDRDRALGASAYYAENSLTEADFEYGSSGGRNTLRLPEEKWGLVKSIGLSVYVDDGEGYIDLGVDNVFEWTDDGDLVLDNPGSWIAIDGQAVSYYLLSEETEGDRYCYTGYVPALVNGDRMNLILVFDNNNPYGSVVGAQADYLGGTDAVAKVDTALAEGDVIDFVCDFYDYDGNYEDSYMFGDRITVPKGGMAALEIYNVSTEDVQTVSMYRLTDIYGNEIWTQGIVE
ncbi:MAG: peptidase C11 [Clostridiales Family XIII bacterium]|jgi:hypothetical protein|nr:peptidase C11 [Clostridiales Family XIII bacterium]